MRKALAIMLGASMVLGLAACMKPEPPSEKDLQKKLEDKFDGEFELEEDNIADDKSEAEYVFISDDGTRQVTVNWNAKDPDDLEFEEKSLIDGTWVCDYDLTQVLGESFGEGFALDGSVIMHITLIMDDGEYELGMDGEQFASDFTAFIENNVDALLYEALGTSDPAELDEYAAILGYDGYQDMADDLLATMLESVAEEDFDITDGGTYEIDGSAIMFESDYGDGFEAEFEDGKISFTYPDEDNIMGGEDFVLVFEKAD
ncbi:MAG: hypothetical protein IK128_07400 [Clostridiales bacterium]|nr:hypothetical protein [Clostridiales bacterium]